MDSGNSGGSSSPGGDDQEHDSLAAPQNPDMLPHQHPLFDPLSNYFNLDSAWAHTPQDHNINSLFTSLSSPFSPPPTTTMMPPQQLTPAASSSSGATQAQVGTGGPQRNPRKRSRASRRAPTTVLTTDTTNFRAMVQEFTGIPAPPFASSSPFARAKLDFLGASPTIRSDHPPYLLRPFAQKFQPPPLPLQLTNFQSLSQGLVTLGNDQIAPGNAFGSNNGCGEFGFGLSQDQVSGMPSLVSSEGNLGILQGEKASGNVAAATRTDGLMEPWLCSSDNR